VKEPKARREIDVKIGGKVKGFKVKGLKVKEPKTKRGKVEIDAKVKGPKVGEKVDVEVTLKVRKKMNPFSKNWWQKERIKIKIKLIIV